MPELTITADLVADHGLTPGEYDCTQKLFSSRPHDCCHPERSEGSAFRAGPSPEAPAAGSRANFLGVLCASAVNRAFHESPVTSHESLLPDNA